MTKVNSWRTWAAAQGKKLDAFVQKHGWEILVGVAALALVLLVIGAVNSGPKKQEAHAIVLFGAKISDAEAQLQNANREALEPGLKAMVRDVHARTEANKAAINAVDLRVKTLEATPFDFKKYEEGLKKDILDILRKEGVPVSQLNTLRQEVVELQANFLMRAAA